MLHASVRERCRGLFSKLGNCCAVRWPHHGATCTDTSDPNQTAHTGFSDERADVLGLQSHSASAHGSAYLGPISASTRTHVSTAIPLSVVGSSAGSWRIPTVAPSPRCGPTGSQCTTFDILLHLIYHALWPAFCVVDIIPLRVCMNLLRVCAAVQECDMHEVWCSINKSPTTLQRVSII